MLVLVLVLMLLLLLLLLLWGQKAPLDEKLLRRLKRWWGGRAL